MGIIESLLNCYEEKCGTKEDELFSYSLTESDFWECYLEFNVN